MSFENTKEIIIDNFIENLKECNILAENESLTYSQIEDIHVLLDYHEPCYDSECETFNEENLNIIESYVYDNNSVSIECNCCNSVVIDSDALFAK